MFRDLDGKRDESTMKTGFPGLLCNLLYNLSPFRLYTEGQKPPVIALWHGFRCDPFPGSAAAPGVGDSWQGVPRGDIGR